MENETQHQEQRSTEKVAYSSSFQQQKPAIQVAIFVMWKIHHKEYQVGSRLFFEQVESQIKVSKSNYKEALAFLEGASIAVNEVIIADKVPPTLIERYDIN
ncbi:hypothetical protein [Enterococcus sp. AZ196]|uniref:hypothetical protein n=1 Tax=Enterococcus sp. AZ196 TaxID=2774659 RepID=UPI003D2D335F